MKKKRKPQELPQKLKNKLRGAKDSFGAFSEIRQEVGVSLYPALTAWLPTIAQRQPELAVGRFPHSHAVLAANRRVFDALPIRNEIIWTSEYLLRFASQINEFLGVRNSFQSDLLYGRYAAASRGLDGLESQLGYSLWSIESRLALASIWKGLEGQKSYASQIHNLAHGNFASFFAYYVSQRNEETTTPQRFRTFLSDTSRSWNITDEYRTYILFRLADQWNTMARDLSSVLRYEASSSVVDYYETFVRLAARAISLHSPIAESFSAAAEILSVLVADDRLKKMLFLQTGIRAHLDGIRLADETSKDLFLQGDYESALKVATSPVPQNAEARHLYIAARAAAELGENRLVPDSSLHSKLTGLFYKLITKPGGGDEAFVELDRLRYNLRWTSFSSTVNLFALRHISPLPLMEHPPAIMAFIDDPCLASMIISDLPQQHAEIYAAVIKPATPCGLGVDVEQAKVTSIIPDTVLSRLEANQRNEIQAEIAYRQHDMGGVREWASLLRKSTSISFRRVGARFHSRALLESGSLDDTIDFIVNAFLADPGCIRMLPLKESVAKLNKNELKKLASKLTTPIILDLFTRFIDDRRGDLRGYTYEDFLLAHGLKKPSELSTKAGEFPRDQLIYYLRHICVPNVMQISTAFQSSRELEDERLAVCAALLTLDKDNANEYEAEIREITRRQIIDRGVRQIEQSKISVDTEPLRRWADRTLKESFLRYQALRNAGLEARAEGIERAYQQILFRQEETAKLPQIPAEESSELLVTVLTAFLNEVMINPYHGLDCYLSMRIRHGALSGHLRASLEIEKLITQRKGASDEYARNDYWFDRIDNLNHESAIKIDYRLRTFSREYDKFINSFTGDIVQIKSNDKPLGLFKTNVTSLQVVLLARDIHGGTTFDEFVDLCFAVFWQNVDACLLEVRSYIDTILKSTLNGAFSSLLADVEKIIKNYRVVLPELVDAIHTARTQARQSLDEVKEWFQQAKSLPNREFSLEELVDIGLQQVKRLHVNFDPVLKTRICAEGQFLDINRFSDIFFNLFENIQKHSGLFYPLVTIHAQMDRDTLEISIENEIAQGVKSADAESRIDRIRKAMDEGASQRATRSEGGTGLIKLRNVFRSAMSGPNKLEFGFTERETFTVRISLPIIAIEGPDK
jgi:hypothetical protein